MRLEITSTNDVSKRKIKILIAGDPKIGKTSLVKTLPYTSEDKVLYIPSDPGDMVLRDKAYKRIAPPNNSWRIKDLEDLYTYIIRNINLYEWVIIDGLCDLGQYVLNERKEANTNALRAYDEYGTFCEEWIKKIRDIDGINTLFLTAISKEIEGDTTKFYPDVPGKVLKYKLDRFFDIIGQLRYVQTETSVQRMIQVWPEADIRYLCGDRSGSLNALEPPDLGLIIKKIEKSMPGSTSITRDKYKEAMQILKTVTKKSVEVRNKIMEEFGKLGTDPARATQDQLLNVFNLLEKDIQNELDK